MHQDCCLIFTIWCSKMFLRAFLLLVSIQSCASVDTITPTSPLMEGDVLTSESGKFTLGFFSPGNSTRRKFVGIWFSKVTVQTIVWVANGDKPINGPRATLLIDRDGHLTITTRKTTIWSTDIAAPVSVKNINSTSCKLLDSGNLVLTTSNGNYMLWQSFDHITDTFLPGMKLGLDKRTGIEHYLTSWRSKDDPGLGNLSFRVDPNGSPQFFLYRDSSPIWRTGPWVGQKWSRVPDMTHSSMIINYRFVNDINEVSVSYKVLNDSIISIFMVDGHSGTIQRRTWHENTNRWIVLWSAPKEVCDQYDECGVFASCNPNCSNQFQCTCFPGYEPKSVRDWNVRNGSQGCVRQENRSMCNNGEGFLKLEHMKVPDTSNALVNKTLTLKECEEECLKNCSCTGYTSAGTGCITLYGVLKDIRVYPLGGQDVYFRADAVELEKYRKSKVPFSKKKIEAVLIVIMVMAFTLLVVFMVYWRHLKKKKEERSLWTINDEESDLSSDLPFFTRNEIAAATDNFSLANKLGEGGFGSVYKGKLENGQEIAVKKLALNSGQGIQEFKNEVRLIAKLQHRNLVKMLGCCVQGEEKMLIYEFMPNKSLDTLIFNEENRSLLDWKKRFEIIIGIARGVLYLHRDSRLRIIHRDLKASNILLDKNMVPKISDFGMARIFGNEQLQVNTTRVVGTFGYMAPEYALEGLLSIKSDVFSFGVLLLEIITGRKNLDFSPENPFVNLVGCVWDLWKEGRALEIVDKSLREYAMDEELLSCIQIGLLCVQECADDRPTMTTVMLMLSSKVELPSPNQPAFIHKGSLHHVDPSLSSVEACSVNGLSITTIINGR
ncbi:G-type lectin S-receptor-like serine/threonine-protein kinase At1g11410 isoform X2 [Amaranthus tricolor]|uniref:G-type lectin S-receptor-like serine/threonine-protein kinase At1g11410 isoform X2 n=1 Tax=Amaranthus tricolor TaxID=29722 RepID=UPI002586D453|nr:G-type lectin S-receptor-like serine/threonine-protein kinase At1g11410 isoform X2 [Amaranthus tricolor]